MSNIKMEAKMIFLQNRNRIIHPILKKCFIKPKDLLIVKEILRMFTIRNPKDLQVIIIRMTR